LSKEFPFEYFQNYFEKNYADLKFVICNFEEDTYFRNNDDDFYMTLPPESLEFNECRRVLEKNLK